MVSYFFIPGNKLEKTESIRNLGVKIIIDLEDAVGFSERETILDNLILQSSSYISFYIRLPLYSRDEVIDVRFLSHLIAAGYKKFVFPKLQSASDLDFIISNINHIGLEIVLLVESARFFLELQKAVVNHLPLIKAIALGSHDFMKEIGGEHTMKNLEYPRLHLLYLARMINVEAIDIASMEIKSENKLKHEILDGFAKGYDAKFYIHPWQIIAKKSIKFYSQEDFLWAKKVIQAFEKVNNENEFNPIIIDDQIIERPHISRAKKILQYYETE